MTCVCVYVPKGAGPFQAMVVKESSTKVRRGKLVLDLPALLPCNFLPSQVLRLGKQMLVMLRILEVAKTLMLAVRYKEKSGPLGAEDMPI